jgi:DNA polymerase III alpha subunit
MHIRQVTGRSLETIMNDRRENGRFRNLQDFLHRVHPGHIEIRHLILVGAFDGFGLTRPELLFALDGIYNRTQSETPSLFGSSFGRPDRQLHPGLSDYSLAQKCLDELQLLGFMLSGDILDILDLHPAARNTVAAADLKGFAGRRVKVFGWPITRRPHMVETSGRSMMFITLDDRTGTIDVILWPDVYERFFDTINDSGPFEVWGTVSESYDTWTLEADTLRSVEWSPDRIDFERASQRLANSYARIAIPDLAAGAASAAA